VRIQSEVGDLEPRPKRRRRRRSRRLPRRGRHRQVRPDVQRHLLVELRELLPAARQRVKRQPDPPAGALDAAAELALFFDREPQRALPEPRQLALPAALVVPERAPRGEPLGRAGLVAEAVEVGQRRRRGERSRRRWNWFWFGRFVSCFFLFFFLDIKSSRRGSVLGSRRHRRAGRVQGSGFAFDLGNGSTEIFLLPSPPPVFLFSR
jgi:hypothetical protein